MKDLLILVYALFMIPRFLRKSRTPRVRDLLGIRPPVGSREKRIWVHAVSLGEMKAALALICPLQETAEVLVTTSTCTGFDEAARHGLNVRFFPLDLSFTMRRWLKSFRPGLILFIEGDLWPNLLAQARRLGIPTALVSGKCSKRSARRLVAFPFAGRALYGKLDLIAAQSETMAKRIAPFAAQPIQVMGNLKLTSSREEVAKDLYEEQFSLSGKTALTVSCTHAPEEAELLDILAPVLAERSDIVLFLAPRHPERFEEIARLLKARRIPFCRFAEKRQGEQAVLVDAMGRLPVCYSLSRLAILGGSFSSKVGGHNVFEPILYHCPVLFGPFMQNQEEMASLVLASRAGRQAAASELPVAIAEILFHQAEYRARAEKSSREMAENAEKILDMLRKIWR